LGCLAGFAGDEDDLGGVTEIGYTWCAQAILYSRSALEDVLRLRLHELIWAQDETLPHLYSRNPWNHRFVDALRKRGWRRRWVVGGPSDDLQEGAAGRPRPRECLEIFELRRVLKALTSPL
ncbi:unnamed protein product, partial [Polarella glacialis]